MDSNAVAPQIQALAELAGHSLSFFKSMTLKCAIDLGIPDAIKNHGKPMTLTELHSALSISPSKKTQLARLLRTLAHYGFISQHGGEEAVYDLTATSCLSIDKRGNDFNLFSWLLNSIVVNSSLFMGDFFKQENKETALKIAYGCDFWELSNKKPEMNKIFNDAMASTSSLYMDFIIKNYGNVFQGIESLVDVGGGTGLAAKVIAENFPHIKCSVLELPQVVADLPNDGIVNLISGDMFNYVPPTNAAFLKFILHNWSDENCIKILKRCKEAIPSKDAGGKVIILDMVVGSVPNPVLKELHLLFDMMMMTMHGGEERDEHQWKNIFEEAGFISHKITHALGGFVSIIEVYP